MPDVEHPGSYYEMQLLEPLSWLGQNGAAIGRWIDLSLPELRVSGLAQVQGIDPCPPIESGYGRVLLGTFTSVSSDVYELKLVGQDEAIGVTYGHPIWSLDRGGWASAGAMQTGERLATTDGEAVVEYVTAEPGQRRVYNLSVEGDHHYLVSDLGILAHNVGECSGPNVATIWESIKNTVKNKLLRAVSKLQDKAQARPDIWGSWPSTARAQRDFTLNHAKDILDGPGSWMDKLNNTGPMGPHYEKFLPDGRGIAATPDGTFLTFLNAD